MQIGARSAWSCENCRRRKVRCNNEDPCKNCTRRREECRWPENVQFRRAGGQSDEQTEDISLLKARVGRLEALLNQAGAPQTRVDAIQDSDFDRRDAGASGGRLTDVAPNGSSVLIPRRESDPQHSQTVRHESLWDKAEGPIHGRNVEIEDLAAVQSDAHLRLAVHKHDDFDHHIIDGSLQKQRAKDAAARATEDEARAIVSRAIPGRDLSDELLDSYLLNVEWIHHILHVPEFRLRYDTFWRDQPNYLSDLQWLALLFTILCLGSHFSEECRSAHREQELYASAQELLVLSDHLTNHSVTTIQTLILMGLWLNDQGYGNTHHAQLGLAIKMAMSMGMSKLDSRGWSNSPSDDAAFFDLFQRPLLSTSDTKHEMKRRLWWSLVCQDYYTASSCSFTYIVHPKQCKTQFFSNVDDQDLTLHGDSISRVVVPALQDVATSSSYHLLKIPFARVAKAMTDLYNEDALSYEAVLDLEKLLWTTYDSLPDHFKWDNPVSSMPASQHVHPDHLRWQRLFLGFTVHNRVLRLHRPFMAHGYSNTQMVHSRQATIESALACITLAEQGREINFPGLRWWVVLIHIFTSGVALCIDYHFLLQYRRKSSGGPDLTQLARSRRRQISRATKLLRSAANHNSIAAHRALSVIDGLVTQAEDPRRSDNRSANVESARRKRPCEATGSDTRPSHPDFSTRNYSDGATQQAVSVYTTDIPPPSAHIGHNTFGPSHVVAAEPSVEHPATTQQDLPYTGIVPSPLLSGPSDGIYASPQDSFTDASASLETPEQNWSSSMYLDDWSGPDWNELLASMSTSGYSPNGGIGTDLYDTINSFANSFLPN